MRSDNKRCLSESEFGAYVEGSLSAVKKASINEHLVECQHCRQEFAAINSVIIQKDDMVEEDAPEYLIKKVVGMFPEKSGLFDIVLNLVRDSVRVVYCSHDIDMFMPLPAAGLRSGKAVRPEMIVLKKSFEDIDVELDVEKVAGSLCNIRVTIDDLKAKVLMNTLRVELISEDRELVSNLLEDGETILEDIGSGKYTIKIHKKGKIFGEIALKIE
jgi:hypothetical protein